MYTFLIMSIVSELSFWGALATGLITINIELEKEGNSL